MRRPFIGIQGTVLHQVDRKHRGIMIRHNLVIITMDHQYRDGDLLEILSEIRLREGEDRQERIHGGQPEPDRADKSRVNGRNKEHQERKHDHDFSHPRTFS